MKLSRLPIRRFLQAAKALFFLHFTNEHVFALHFTLGSSMLPTLNVAGDTLAVDKLFFKWNLAGGPRGPLGIGLGSGDIVFALSPEGNGWAICIRIIGMPGDIICKDPSDLQSTYIQIPPGHVLLAGDNISSSIDSRRYGPIPIALIRGKVIARVWPEPKWIRNGLKAFP